MKRWIGLAALVLIVGISFSGQEIVNIGPQKAFEMVKEPSTFLIDVRSVAEYVLIGHPVMALNIPLSFWSETEATFVPNENFVQDLKARFKAEDTILFICRSGGRSLRAAQAAREAGFAKVFSLSEGFEGAADDKGYRTIGGWKNSGLAYTFKSDPQLAYKPKTGK